MTLPLPTPLFMEKRFMMFPENSAIMSRNPGLHRTAMLFVESWPSAAPDSAEISSQTYSAPHVIACSNASVLLELQRNDINMVVWCRVVPDIWHKTLANRSPSQTVFDMSGTPGELAEALTSRMMIKEFPPLILSDVAELSDLFSAITKSCPQRIRLEIGACNDTNFSVTPGTLRLVCCYGASDAEWCSSPDPETGIINALDPFAVAFIKGADDQGKACIHRICRTEHSKVNLGIYLVIDTVTG
ncbi:DUF1826 domain-containing protein [Acetobacter thailandicus]|nr:DUF1826 domain-containing protein [Acetobacter thailandicus]